MPSGMHLDFARRQAMKLLLGSAAATAAGCCNLRGFPKAEIHGRTSEAHFVSQGQAATFLAPSHVNTVDTPTSECIDTHAHFFNASDVTIRGYLEGPLAYSLEEPLRTLVKLLAPLADAFGEIAPSAKREYDSLQDNAVQAAVVSPSALRDRLIKQRDGERETVSTEFTGMTAKTPGARRRPKIS